MYGKDPLRPTYAAVLGFLLHDCPRRAGAVCFEAVLFQEDPRDVLRFPLDTPATHTQQDPTEAVHESVLLTRVA
jgi:hypothetical protein